MSNNQTEYESLTIGLYLVKDMDATRVCLKNRLIVGGWPSQGNVSVKDYLLVRYYHKVVQLMKEFEVETIEHIPQSKNTRANFLSKLENNKEKW